MDRPCQRIAGNTTLGTFWASANLIAGWGSIVEFSLHLAGAPSWLLRERGEGPGLCPNKYGERSGCYGCVPTVTVHEVRTLSPQIAPRRMRVGRMNVGYSGGVDGARSVAGAKGQHSPRRRSTGETSDLQNDPR